MEFVKYKTCYFRRLYTITRYHIPLGEQDPYRFTSETKYKKSRQQQVMGVQVIRNRTVLLNYTFSTTNKQSVR